MIEESDLDRAAQPTTDAIELSAIQDALAAGGPPSTPTAASNPIPPLIVLAGIGVATAATLAVGLPRLSAYVVSGVAVVAVGVTFWWARHRSLASNAVIATLRTSAGAVQRRVAAQTTELARMSSTNNILRQRNEDLLRNRSEDQRLYSDELTRLLDVIALQGGTRTGASPAGRLDPLNADPVMTLVAELRNAVSRVRDNTTAPGDDSGFAQVLANIGRRTQELTLQAISKLNDIIGQLDDPDILGVVFLLDNLLSRNLRLAENLILVGGANAPRQWRDGLRLMTVLRGAQAEMDQYTRVKTIKPSEVTIVGYAAAPLIHLIAELLENATQFSEPTTDVKVSARPVTAGFAIFIEDQGVGMSYDKLDEVNAYLGGTARSSVGVLREQGRLMGLWMVGHLARRYGIKVRLTGNIFGGVDAEIVIPASLLVSTPAPTAVVGASSSAKPIPEPAVAAPQSPATDNATAQTSRPRQRPLPAAETGGAGATEDNAGWPDSSTSWQPQQDHSTASPADPTAADDLPPLPKRPRGMSSLAPQLRAARRSVPTEPPADSPGPDVAAGFLRAAQGLGPAADHTPSAQPLDGTSQGAATADDTTDHQR